MSTALDQAAGLRHWSGPAAASTPAPLVAIASGKGGVGKTFLSVNLALALRELGRSPLLLDLDWGLANVDVALGLAPSRHVGHVLSGECSLDEALIHHEELRILPNGCGESGLVRFTEEQRRGLLLQACLSAGEGGVVLADTHPGISAGSLDVVTRADVTLVVSSAEPTALTDTYALFKVLRGLDTAGRFGVVISGATTPGEGGEAAAHLDMVSQRFLGRPIAHWGTILSDPYVPRSIHQQRPVLLSAPNSPAAGAVRHLARLVLKLLQ